MRYTTSTRLKLACLWLALLGLYACSSSTSEGQEKPVIAVTISPTASIIKTLAGDEVEILNLLPEGTTPESYEPSMKDMQSLSNAKAWFYIGDLGFEHQWQSRIAELNPKLKLVRLDKGLGHIDDGHTHADGSTHCSDPHYWMSIEGIRTMSKNIEEGLKSLLPEQDFSLGRAKIDQKLDSLERLATERPLLSKSFIIYHPSLAYLAHEMHINQLVIEDEGKEPTLQKLSNLIEQAKRDSVRIMFFQREFGVNAQSADYIEKELPLRKKLINPFSDDWFSELRSIICTLQGRD